MFAPVMLILNSASVTACDVKMPETLLSLYRNSNAIYIGRYRGLEEGETTHDDDNYTVVEIKKHFVITSTLKGQPLKSFTHLDTDYRYKDRKAGFETIEEVQEAQVIPENTFEISEDLEEGVAKELKPGDDVLLFLRKDEESNQLVLTDYRDAVKNLPISDINIYEARIKELNSIFAAEKPDTEKIVEWLVRCAEDAATRWEGTYELERSFEVLEYKRQREADRKEKAAQDDDVEEENYYLENSLNTGETTAFATLLNSYQKQTLANLLLNSEFQSAPKRPGQDGFVRGDSELIKLVSRWADDRIALLFTNRLRSGTYSPQENADLMDSIASILYDDELKEMLDNYRENIYQKGDDEVDESDIEDVEEADDNAESSRNEKPAAQSTAGSANSKAESPAPDTSADQKDEEESAKRPSMTFNEYRSKMINKFLLRADKVLINPEALINRSNKKEER